jgi:hypothetical protein
MGARIYAGKKTTNVNLDELPPLATGQLREAFVLIPGLLVSEVSNRSWSSINYRGLGEPHESWNTLVLKDGIPVSPDPYNYPAAYYAPPLDGLGDPRDRRLLQSLCRRLRGRRRTFRAGLCVTDRGRRAAPHEQRFPDPRGVCERAPHVRRLDVRGRARSL